MKIHLEETPPSSINNDEMSGVEDNYDEDDESDVICLDDENGMLVDLEDWLEENERELEPLEDQAVVVFNKHESSVFCCDIHPNGKLAVTGGQDDKAFVWSVVNGEPIWESTGHKDSITFVGFSFDGVYLATADMSFVVKVWKCNLDENNKDPWPLIFEYEGDNMSFGLWHFGARVLFFGGTNGMITVMNIPSGETKMLISDKNVECAKLFPDGTRLAAGYADGVVKIWDIKTAKVIHNLNVNHDERVNALDTHPDNNLLAYIYTDGKVVFVTSNNGKVIRQFEVKEDLETLAFSPDPALGYLAFGTLQGTLSLWDIPHQMNRYQHENSKYGGVTKLIWMNNNIVTGCLDGSVRVYEGRSGDRILKRTGNTDEVLDLCYNSKNNIILTACNDGSARIFKYEIDKGNE